MNYKKIIALVSALFIMGGTLQTAQTKNIINTAYAEEADTLNFTAVGQTIPVKLTNTNDQTVTWKSDNENIAVVDQNGNVTSKAVGSCNVYAIVGTQVLTLKVVVTEENQDITKPDEPVTVTLDEIHLDHANNTAVPSFNGADTKDAKWTSSDTEIATVDETGKITAVGKGNCTVTAVLGNTTYIIPIVSDYDPNADSLPEIQEQFVNSFTLTNEKPTRKITTQAEGLTWSSSDENVAIVDQNGNITAVNIGNCRIYAESETVRYYFEVTSEYDPSYVPETNFIGTIELSNTQKSQQINLSNVENIQSVTWKCLDETIAVIDENGIVTAVNSGTCTVTATIGDTTYPIKIVSTYNPEEEKPAEIQEFEIKFIGNTLQLTSPDSDAEWISLDVNTVTVDDKGLVTAVNLGEAEILIKSASSVTTVKIKVTAEKLTGDTNLDGNISISDSVRILQYLANPKKYALDGLALENADAYGENDGVTGKDAYAIQMYDAGAVDKLPLIE